MQRVPNARTTDDGLASHERNPDSHERNPDSSDAVAAGFAACLSRDGPHAALEFLNRRTRFRFTGLYQRDHALLRNISLFDRENPTLRLVRDTVPLHDTYCGIPCGDGTAFATPDSQHDARLLSHAARDSVISYTGVPIRLHTGSVWGTLCHFDNRPRLVAADETAVLETSAREVALWIEATRTDRETGI